MVEKKCGKKLIFQWLSDCLAALVEEEMKWAEERRAAADICEKLWQCGLVWSVHGLFILFGWP